MSTYTGSLLTKRKNDLVEIATALGLPETEARIADLIKSIQSHLEANESSLSQSPQFKGLYKKRSSGTHPPDSDSESPSAGTDIKSTVTTGVKQSRKSINKAFDRIQSAVDAANIPLPESPVSIAKISEVASAANESVSNALVPAQQMSKDLTTRFGGVSKSVITYTSKGQERVDVVVRHLRDLLSTSKTLVASSLAIEILFLFSHVLQFYDHTYYFPPPGGDKGTLASLLHALFFWLPTFTLTFRLPEASGLFGSDLWSASAWWFFTTVLPPLALSTVVSFGPQKGIHRHGGPNTRYQASHPPIPTPDLLTFTFIRLALLLLPLTSAAPSSFVDALEISGNLQGRALGAGLLAALVVAEKLHQLA
ncbi:hypothetical protein IAR55_005843 [Kwoniella newhampshirensis]|uniref:SAP domain-containing protein n=1 Tax=Kwoniella newhampshirensis TaxID=1651941 RepID=A0AAW0YGF0_9TREE